MYPMYPLSIDANVWTPVILLNPNQLTLFRYGSFIVVFAGIEELSF